MNKLFVILSMIELSFSGLVEHHEGATSYQNIHMEHFHPVPTFIKKEHKHLLEHPISIGKSSSKVEIHHGGKHDHGYAIASVENDAHGKEFEGFSEGHEAGYQVQDHHQFELGHDASSLDGDSGDLGHYHQLAAQGYQHQEELDAHQAYGAHE